MVTVAQKLLRKRKGRERCRASCVSCVYRCCHAMRCSQYLLAEEAEKSIWKRLCWLQVSVAFGGASCKNRQIRLQWKGVMGQLQPNCYPGGVLEALAGSREMHLPGEDCIANRPCPSLSVNSFGSRLAPEHLKIFMIKLEWFFFSSLWDGDGVCIVFIDSYLTNDSFKRSRYSSHSLVVAPYLAEGQVKTCFSVSRSYMA